MREIGANLVNRSRRRSGGRVLPAKPGTRAVGRTLDLTHSYTPVFPGIGLMMPAAWAVGMTLMKRVEPVEGLE
jgi:hypothetical protein